MADLKEWLIKQLQKLKPDQEIVMCEWKKYENHLLNKLEFSKERID
jgi:hypothetical protein